MGKAKGKVRVQGRLVHIVLCVSLRSPAIYAEASKVTNPSFDSPAVHHGTMASHSFIVLVIIRVRVREHSATPPAPCAYNNCIAGKNLGPA